MTTQYQDYYKGMIARFQEYRENYFSEDVVDMSAGEGHVFTEEDSTLNLFLPELGSLIPPSDRHKWFRSMTSSQALAVSVIGTIVQRGDLELLCAFICDDLLPLVFKETVLEFDSFEYVPRHLEKGKRKSQVDVYIRSPGFRLSIECKLTEKDTGQCRMSKEGEQRDAYSEFSGFTFCDRVRYNGARYWDYWPKISDQPRPETCTEECPLHSTYQLARNVMAAGIEPETGEFDEKGSALLLYDDRNPGFQVGDDISGLSKAILSSSKSTGEGIRSFATLKMMLKNTTLLRSATWQSLAGLLWAEGSYEDLLRFLKEKYGILPDKLLYSERNAVDGV